MKACGYVLDSAKDEMARTMIRVARRLSSMLAWLMLVIGLAIFVIWIRSYWAMDFFGRMTFVNRGEGPQSITIGIASGRGGIGYWNSNTGYPPGVKFDGMSWQAWLRPQDGKLRWRVLDQLQYPFVRSPQNAADRFGFFFVHINSTAPPPWALDGSQIRSWRMEDVVLPYWFLLAIIGFWPAFYFGERITRELKTARRKRYGLCVNCGYDLREQ